jgi:hypothetical protein
MAKYAQQKGKSTWHQASVDSIEAAEEADYEQWQSRTWKFTRAVKGQYPKLSAEEIMNLVPWHETEFDEEDQVSFMREWTLVRFIPGQGPLDWAWQMAQERPLGAPPSSPYGRFEFYRKVIGIAGWLQVLVGEKNTIFLPGRRVGAIIGASNRTVSTMCNFAVKDGILELVEEHTSYEAARYRFKIERNRILARWLTSQRAREPDDSE